MFPDRELGADAVDPDEDGAVVTGVPYTLETIDLLGVDFDVRQSVR